MVKPLDQMLMCLQVIGKIVKVCEDAPISYKHWEDVPLDNKNKIYYYVLVRLVIILYHTYTILY